MFDMTSPCDKCPFRSDIAPYLRRDRAREIATSLRAGQSFPCHKTTTHDDDGEYVPRSDEQHCAGATIILEKMSLPNQMMRISERLRMYDRGKMNMDAPVYASLAAWVAAQGAGEGQ